MILFPGGFKPPHIGHYLLVTKLLKKYPKEKFYILISPKPRLVIPPFDKKIYQLSDKLKENIINNDATCGQKIKENNLTKKIYKIIDKGCLPAITAETSLKIWNEYFPAQPQNLKIMISPMDSPIYFAYILGKSLKKGDNLILVKSSKDHLDARFKLFSRLENKGIKIDEFELPKFQNLSSQKIRELIYKNKYNEINKYLPDINKKEREKVLTYLGK